MITVGVPGLTAAQVAAWVINKPVPIQSFSGGFYDPISPLLALPGQWVQFLVEDTRWVEARAACGALAILANIARVRVCFDTIDMSGTAGRPVGRIAWVYQDGHQEEA